MAILLESNVAKGRTGLEAGHLSARPETRNAGDPDRAGLAKPGEKRHLRRRLRVGRPKTR
jgi:hypothetical protein